jgi:fructose-1-phosphate kinase PfkB-like protein
MILTITLNSALDVTYRLAAVRAPLAGSFD